MNYVVAQVLKWNKLHNEIPERVEMHPALMKPANEWLRYNKPDIFNNRIIYTTKARRNFAVKVYYSDDVHIITVPEFNAELRKRN